MLRCCDDMVCWGAGAEEVPAAESADESLATATEAPEVGASSSRDTAPLFFAALAASIAARSAPMCLE